MCVLTPDRLPLRHGRREVQQRSFDTHQEKRLYETRGRLESLEVTGKAERHRDDGHLNERRPHLPDLLGQMRVVRRLSA